MFAKILKERRRLRRNLTTHSWRTYQQLLGRLCADHRGYEVADTVGGLLRNNRIDDLYAYADSLVTQSYVTAKDHFLANQFAALIRKYPFPKNLTKLDPRGEALRKFRDAEELCSEVNRKFLSPYLGRDLEYYLHRMRSFISYVIGDEPDVVSCLQKCDFGPGASLGVHGDGTSFARKILADEITVGPCALAYVTSAFRYNDHLVELCAQKENGQLYFEHSRDVVTSFLSKRVRLVAHNQITFVPKTAKTHRSIAVEPSLNSFLQKGVDTFMRLRLKRIGIDLSDQAGNVSLARHGSAQWDTHDPFCTIDLSSASDSISLGLCKRILPNSWFNFLNCIRSSSYLLDGVVKPYEKFCSMGNGFCFPLETLIFSAACHAVNCGNPKTDFLVYGDDIIVRRSKYDELIGLLNSIGFRVNEEKSFSSGPFRESCGGDFFAGEDVRPFTLDYALDSVENVFKFLNLTRRNQRTAMFFEGVRDFVMSLIPSTLRLVRPLDGPPDTAITAVGDEFLTSPFTKWNKNTMCWTWLELVARSVPDNFWQGSRYAASLHVIAALRGSRSEALFSWRRKTRTTVRKVSYGATGATPVVEGSATF